MKIFFYFFLIALLIVGAAFSLLNAQLVRIHYYFGVHEIPLSLLLIITLSIGVLFGFFMTVSLYIQQKRQNYHLKKKVRTAEKEIENLRTIPIRDFKGG